MERLLKVMASLLTLVIVLSIYPALLETWFIQPNFWVIYFLCIGIDLWCINRLKAIQSGKNK